MSLFVRILLIVLPILYIISPIDAISDFIPFIGWIDDLAVLGFLIYFLRKGRVPGFLNFFGKSSAAHQGSAGSQHTQQQSGSGTLDKTPWEILEIEQGASVEEIHSAYRKAAQTYHPDKVQHLGPEFQEIAKQKFVEIQEAYQFLTKHVGKE